MTDSPQAPAGDRALAERFLALVALVERLRAPGGCPWDRAQTARDLRTYILEEAYEVVEAIDRDRPAELAEELGDLLFQVLFLSSLAAEEGRFGLAEVLEAVQEKMVRRHPHVFGTARASTPQEVVERWNRIKEREKAEEAGAPSPSGRHPSLLGDVPRALPALYRAFKLGSRAARVGFDWPDAEGVLEKIEEEMGELAAARAGEDRGAIEHEVGDLLFALASLARHLGVEPEQALRACNSRFRRRFRRVEEMLHQRDLTPAEAGPAELDRLWEAAKAAEKAAADDPPC